MPPLGVVISPFCPAMLTKYQRRGIFFFNHLPACAESCRTTESSCCGPKFWGLFVPLSIQEHDWASQFVVASFLCRVYLCLRLPRGEYWGGWWVGRRVCGSHYQPFAFHPSGKGYLRNRAAIKAAPHKPLRTIFCFTPKHAHSFHLCVVLKWTLRDIVAPRSKTRMIYLPEEGTNLFQICFHRPHSWATSQQRVGRGSRAADWSRYCSVSLFFWARVWICAWGRSRQISEGDRKAGRPTGLKPLLLQLPLDFSPATV